VTYREHHRGWISKLRPAGASAAQALAVLLIIATQSAPAQTFAVLYTFTGGTDGGYPFAGLVRDGSGNLYGTTYQGGAFGAGTVFKVETSGTETVLYNFTAGTDGGYPFAGLVRDAKANLYGTTYQGGALNYGVVFKVDTNGNETVLHSFAGGTADGCAPYGGLLRDKAGNLYGVTDGCGASNKGTMYKVAPSGVETVLHSFTGSDGAYPSTTGLLIDKQGNLYGVTDDGGSGRNCNSGYGCGVAYVLTSSGTLTVLHSFARRTADGCYPQGTPARDNKGNLYGTTESCGSSGEGIVWKVSKKGTETVLHSFAGGASDGVYPTAGVVMDATGNLYGDTDGGGTSSAGTVYELDKKWEFTLLHSFNGGTDGTSPSAGLTRDAKGNFYGTAPFGGSSNYGTVWKLTP
jgi:uncharacterized repeat protein (TIGR03803 family)